MDLDNSHTAAHVQSVTVRFDTKRTNLSRKYSCVVFSYWM